MFIYKLTNIINDKLYVGYTKNLKRRWSLHKSKAKENPKTLIGRAIHKYGSDNFTMSVLEECDETIVSQRETFWISELRVTAPEIGYNITKGGEGGDTFRNNPNQDEIRKKCAHRG